MTSSRKPRLFGTDGIRAPFGSFPLDESTVTRVAYEAARATKSDGARAFVGGDTRDSTAAIAGWITRGVEAATGSVSFGGTVPTPGVAHGVREGGYDFGIAISASHNPWPDNGIKLFDQSGFKWTVEAERALEAALDSETDGFELGSPASSEAPVSSEAVNGYLDALRGSISREDASSPLSGLRVVLDCAQGATSDFAPDLFRSLGAEIFTLGDQPDGRNINLECGSTHPEAMARATIEHKAHIGLAFDGDGDRVLFADETGTLRDGDALLFLLATQLHAAGELPDARIVATSMSNIGLERALDRYGISVERCDVGDRVVVETMRENNLRLGGEQSGHIIDLTRASTGDGMLTALHLAHGIAVSGQPISEALEEFARYPQVLKNVRVSSKPPFDELPSVREHAERITDNLADEGRLVLRYSGTEPLARVMIEGQDQQEIDTLALSLCKTIEEAIGATS